jgi:transcriptional regulator with XRE-family HTH domain
MFDNYTLVNCDNSIPEPVHPPLDLSEPVMQSVDMRDQRLRALANYVRARRVALNLNQGDLASRGGPGVVTVGKIERGEIAKPEVSTLRRLDTALQWEPGSAAAVLDGGQVRELVDDAPGAGIIAAISRESRLIPEARAHLLNQLELLLRLPPQEDGRAKQDGRRRDALASVPDNEAEREVQTAEMKARVEARKRPKETPGTPRKITPAKRPK